MAINTPPRPDIRTDNPQRTEVVKKYAKRTGRALLIKIGAPAVAALLAGGIGLAKSGDTKTEAKPTPVEKTVKPSSPTENSNPYPDYPIANRGEIINVPVPLPTPEIQEKYESFQLVRQAVENRWVAACTNNVYLLQQFWESEQSAGYQNDLEEMKALGPDCVSLGMNPEHLNIGYVDLSDGKAGYTLKVPGNKEAYSLGTFNLVEVDGQLRVSSIEY